MIEEMQTDSELVVYAKKHSIRELSGEDILKLITKSYLMKDIIEVFKITEREWKDIRKQKGIENVILENSIRNIETILKYVDSKNRYVSNPIRKKIVNEFITEFITSVPKSEFYVEKLSTMDFSRSKVSRDIKSKKIDYTYRSKELNDLLKKIDIEVEEWLKEEKVRLLEYNNQKMYKKLCAEKEKGKKFSKDDLTYDILFELAIIEGTIDANIGDLFNMTVSQVRHTRKKFGLQNKYHVKLEKYPETIIYYMEECNGRPQNTSNEELEMFVNFGIQRELGNAVRLPDDKEKFDIVIEIDGEDHAYHVNFSNEKYTVHTKTENRKNHGTRHNYRKENETKRIHGKIGEQIALQAEKKRLINKGLAYYASQVKLIAQIDEDITFDGLGYDLLSFDEVGEPICIEVKTSYGSKDKPFFISKKEIEIMNGLKEEHDCKRAFIYYVLIDGENVTIKNIDPYDFSTMKLTPVLYRVEQSER